MFFHPFSWLCAPRPAAPASPGRRGPPSGSRGLRCRGRRAPPSPGRSCAGGRRWAHPACRARPRSAGKPARARRPPGWSCRRPRRRRPGAEAASASPPRAREDSEIAISSEPPAPRAPRADTPEHWPGSKRAGMQPRPQVGHDHGGRTRGSDRWKRQAAATFVVASQQPQRLAEPRGELRGDREEVEPQRGLAGVHRRTGAMWPMRHRAWRLRVKHHHGGTDTGAAGRECDPPRHAAPSNALKVGHVLRAKSWRGARRSMASRMSCRKSSLSAWARPRTRLPPGGEVAAPWRARPLFGRDSRARRVWSGSACWGCMLCSCCVVRCPDPTTQRRTARRNKGAERGSSRCPWIYSPQLVQGLAGQCARELGVAPLPSRPGRCGERGGRHGTPATSWLTSRSTGCIHWLMQLASAMPGTGPLASPRARLPEPCPRMEGRGRAPSPRRAARIRSRSRLRPAPGS